MSSSSLMKVLAQTKKAFIGVIDIIRFVIIGLVTSYYFWYFLRPITWLYNRFIGWPNRHINDWKKPHRSISRAFALPLRMLTKPDAIGLENIPGEPVLFVGNHQLYGIDTPQMIINLLEEEMGIWPRSLSDNVHWAIPFWKHILEYGGVVKGNKENAIAIMARGKESLLVFPGGAEEVMKKKSDPKYELMWKNRTGFAKLAIQHGYPIVPFAAVGLEDIMRIQYDIPMGWLLRFFGDKRHKQTVPMVSPFYLKPQKTYYIFGRPIDTKRFKGDWQNHDNVLTVRDETKAAIVAGVQTALARQSSDPHRYLGVIGTIKAILCGIRGLCGRTMATQKRAALPVNAPVSPTPLFTSDPNAPYDISPPAASASRTKAITSMSSSSSSSSSLAVATPVKKRGSINTISSSTTPAKTSRSGSQDSTTDEVPVAQLTDEQLRALKRDVAPSKEEEEEEDRIRAAVRRRLHDEQQRIQKIHEDEAAELERHPPAVHRDHNGDDTNDGNDHRDTITSSPTPSTYSTISANVAPTTAAIDSTANGTHPNGVADDDESATDTADDTKTDESSTQSSSRPSAVAGKKGRKPKGRTTSFASPEAVVASKHDDNNGDSSSPRASSASRSASQPSQPNESLKISPSAPVTSSSSSGSSDSAPVTPITPITPPVTPPTTAKKSAPKAATSTGTAGASGRRRRR